MKKRIMILTMLTAAVMLLSSCSMLPSTSLEAMFRPEKDTTVTSGEPYTPAVQGSDTVTISREEYEKYQMFSEMYDIFDYANKNFYQETDPKQLVEYATRGLMVGLDDPYSFYYNPEEFAEMWRGITSVSA